MTGYVNSSFGKLRRVLLCKPDFYRLMPSNKTSKKYIERGESLNLDVVKHQYDEFCTILNTAGVDIVFVEPRIELPYQIFTRDLGAVTPCGALLGHFKWEFRRQEIKPAREQIAKILPVWETITPEEDTFFEGGDFMYMDSSTIALGVAGRTSKKGAEIVQRLMGEQGFEVISIYFDPDYCHLDMIFNVVSERICVACLELLPDEFIRRIRREGWEIIETTKQQVLQLLGNIFAIDNGKVISPAHNNKINACFRTLGLDVVLVEMEEILRGGGGPHCMTYPLLRDPL